MQWGGVLAAWWTTYPCCYHGIETLLGDPVFLRAQTPRAAIRAFTRQFNTM